MDSSIILPAAMPSLFVLWAYLSLLGFVLLTAYACYYRFFHPLSGYHGPAIASITNLWKGYQLSTLHMPDAIIKLHEKYGSVVRIGPNDLSFNSSAAVGTIYKAGRKLPKTAFYDGFTAFNPNLFGTQDEEFHALRRRQMAHAFSLQSIKEMESYIDKHIVLLCNNLDGYAKSGEAFDLKDLIAFYVVDMLGELAFSQSFNAQTEQAVEKLPPINGHIYLACLMGQFPEILPFLKKIAVRIPLCEENAGWLNGLYIPVTGGSTLS